MKRSSVIMMACLVIGLGAAGCVQSPREPDAGWITLLDGSSLDHWNAIGKANWRIQEGAVQADKGSGHLVSKNSYNDFQIRAEFCVDADANSGIFLRCSDPQKPGRRLVMRSTSTTSVPIQPTAPAPS